ncbi:xylulose-5-phosphate/fructose-6-phosphate phosphoketolase [Streptomyces sp. DvalAA-14]|uniref:phosphoketolase family protein n=1 Tax=unclassified Streptomyces TaxID=2593676 RepID=UPI00081B95E4|nr:MULTISPECIES: phosphoketolase family protein [unclassified Streptomyces]MYS21970.1 phosphoketolase [Streptomyces sp. SID4948]SCE05654.1 xylulose-5-phosphate/fructose-6-phosphate phosphoketolase [Streptomyces sp. DvalAA-14]
MSDARGPAAPGKEELRSLDAHWRAANYLAVGQIYLMGNPLLTEPLRPEHIKPRLLGHWGTSPGLNLVHTHLNRVIKARELDAICIWGPGHGGPAVVANSWLDGSYTQTYPDITRDADGMGRLFKQFSFPGGIPSHVAPETPGSIHEGGELGYSLSHAYGAAFDNPGLIVACVIGDGEAETGPLAASWHGNKFLDPVHDGAVLPILHLNGYKIANPAVLARLAKDELDELLRGYGHDPIHVGGDDPMSVHRAMAVAMDTALNRIAALQRAARGKGAKERPRWPVIVLRTPKGWTGPATVDGLPVEGTWRAHQVPLAAVRSNPEHLRQLEEWLRSYRPAELFDADGRPVARVLEYLPAGDRRLGANPHANGGLLLRDLPVPDLDRFAVPVEAPGASQHEPTRVLGALLAQLMADTAQRRDFRLVGPDETASNRLEEVYTASGKAWQARTLEVDEDLDPHGRVMEILSEHTCQGWLEGYLLTGRHGLFSCYEAFVHIVDSMVNQHIKWLRTTRALVWRRPIASLNYLLSSHVWRQDHNGFSHQDPGFIDHVLSKSPEAVRVYLPPDANTLLSVAEHVLLSKDYVNVVVAGKQPCFDWLSMDAARSHCARGAGIWDWAGTEHGTREPDVVLACAGDVPTQEVLAAAQLLRRHLPELGVRVVNVVDLARLLPQAEHPHGMSAADYDALFTPDKPVIFAYHGYPWLIHRLAYRHDSHNNLHVRGYKEIGTTTTPFDMVLRNDLDRYRLVMDVIDRVPGLAVRAAPVRQLMEDVRLRHHAWVREHGTDLPEVTDWSWES